MNKFDLTIIRFDVESREELIVHCVIDKLRISDYHCFISIFAELFEDFSVIFKIKDYSWRDLYFFAVINKAGSLIMREDSDNFDENID